MKRILCTAALFVALPLSPQAAQAQAGDYVIDSVNPASIFVVALGTGTWSVGVTDGAWRAWSSTSGCDGSGGGCTRGWLTVFDYALDGDAFTRHGDVNSRWATPELAFANRAAPAVFEVFAPTTLTLRIIDNPYHDNSGMLTVGVNQLPAQVVPEPATLLLLGTGLLGVAGVVRRRRKDGALA